MTNGSRLERGPKEQEEGVPRRAGALASRNPQDVLIRLTCCWSDLGTSDSLPQAGENGGIRDLFLGTKPRSY